MIITQKSRESSNSYLLNMSEGMHSINKHWSDTNSACAKNHPGFDVEKEYYIHWNEINIRNIPFYYCILEV